MQLSLLLLLYVFVFCPPLPSFIEASGAGDLVGKAQVASQVTPWDGVIWLQPNLRRDAMGRKSGDEGFDPRTIQVNTRGVKLSKTQEQYWDIKSKYADVVIFFKVTKTDSVQRQRGGVCDNA